MSQFKFPAFGARPNNTQGGYGPPPSALAPVQGLSPTPSAVPGQIMQGTSRGVPTMQERAALAAQQGFKYNPGTGMGEQYHGRTLFTRPMDTFNPEPSPWDQFPPELLQALMGDQTNMQRAADDQFNRNNAQIAGFSDFLGQAPGQIMDVADSGAGQLNDLAGQARGLGDRQMSEFRDQTGGLLDRARENTGKVEADVNAGYAIGDQAVRDMQDTIAKYGARAAKDASVAAHGIRTNNESAMRQVRAGVNPDGTPMTEGQKAALITTMRQQTQEAVQSAVTPIFSHYNDVNAQLGQALASTRMNNAGLRMTGAQTKLGAYGQEAQVGTTVSGQMLQAHEGERQMMQLASSLTEAGAAMRNAGILQATNLEAQGLFQKAQLVQQNPQTVTSWFQSLLALYGVRAGATGQTFGGPNGGGGASSGMRGGQAGQGRGAGQGAGGGPRSQGQGGAWYDSSYADQPGNRTGDRMVDADGYEQSRVNP